MKKILHKARILETKYRVKHETRKQLKAQYYKLFLYENTPNLPGKKKLKRWRRNFLILGMICLAVPCFQTIFFYQSIWIPPEQLEYGQEPTLEQILQGFINEIPTILGLIWFCFFFLAICVDWVIYRRWPNENTMVSRLSQYTLDQHK